MKLRCFGCGGAVSNELPPDTIVRALILCRECTADSVLRNSKFIEPFAPRSNAQAAAMKIIEPVRAPAPVAPAPPNPDELLTEKQAAAILQVQHTTLSAWRYRGDGPRFVKVSARAVRYRRGELADWLAKREFGSTAEFDK